MDGAVSFIIHNVLYHGYTLNLGMRGDDDREISQRNCLSTSRSVQSHSGAKDQRKCWHILMMSKLITFSY